jgi:hypothetical protein
MKKLILILLVLNLGFINTHGRGIKFLKGDWNSAVK